MSRASVRVGILSAARWAKRLLAKDRYRRKRDRKIAVDWIGAEFTWDIGRDELGRRDIARLRVDGYNPDTHIVHMRHMDLPGTPTSPWRTDSFWSHLRDGSLIRN